MMTPASRSTTWSVRYGDVTAVDDIGFAIASR